MDVYKREVCCWQKVWPVFELSRNVSSYKHNTCLSLYTNLFQHTQPIPVCLCCATLSAREFDRSSVRVKDENSQVLCVCVCVCTLCL